MTDCEMPVAFTFSEPVARKDHKCCECRQVIPKGTKYHRFNGIYKGIGAESFATCQACEKLRHWHDTTSHDDPSPFGHLFDDIRESGMTVEDAIKKMESDDAERTTTTNLTGPQAVMGVPKGEDARL